jgi:hypothetical protein
MQALRQTDTMTITKDMVSNPGGRLSVIPAKPGIRSFPE